MIEQCPEASGLLCDCCGQPMTMRRSSTLGDGEFSCSCGQHWRISGDRVFSAVCAKLYPQKMGWKMWNEWLDHETAERILVQGMREALGGPHDEKRLTELYEYVATLRTRDAWLKQNPQFVPIAECIQKRARNLWSRISAIWKGGE